MTQIRFHIRRMFDQSFRPQQREWQSNLDCIVEQLHHLPQGELQSGGRHHSNPQTLEPKRVQLTHLPPSGL